MGRRKYRRNSWWRWNPEGNIPNLPLPASQEEIENALIDLGESVPSAIEEELEVPSDWDDEVGHISFPAPAQRPRRGRPRKVVQEVELPVERQRGYTCGVCEQFGHNARTCPQGKRKPRKAKAKSKAKQVVKEKKASKKPVKTLNKAQALKIVAKYAGRRGRRSPEFSAALKVLCGRRRRRRRS